jgi:IS605 OrfB family transposase
MASDVSIKSYHIKHNLCLDSLLDNAKKIADYAVDNKNNKKLLTSKYVKHFNLPSAISNQILRKYGKNVIKKATNVNLIVPNQITKTKSGVYNSIIWENGKVTLKPLNLSFRWNPGRKFEKICQVEIDKNKFMISVKFKNVVMKTEFNNILGIDHNCGFGRHILNCANLRNGYVMNLGKSGPKIRNKYFKKRRIQKIKNNKEYRIMKDMDHKMSRAVVNYAFENNLKIVVEDLQGIRNTSKKGNGSKDKNRILNSWSFYRLQRYIEYKSKELGIPFEKVKPHYTSQECSYCGIIGCRNKEKFLCKNKFCKSYKINRNADINAAFNIGKRSLGY